MDLIGKYIKKMSEDEAKLTKGIEIKMHNEPRVYISNNGIATFNYPNYTTGADTIIAGNITINGTYSNSIASTTTSSNSNHYMDSDDPYRLIRGY